MPKTGAEPAAPTYLLIGGARPQRGRIMSTPFLSTKELGMVAKKLAWNSTVEGRMALRYLAVISSVQFAGQSYSFPRWEEATANMDTGGGPIVGVPATVASGYWNATRKRAAGLNMSVGMLDGYLCIESTRPSAEVISAFPPISFVFRNGNNGGSQAKAMVQSNDLILRASSAMYCSVVMPMTGAMSSVPTAFWPSQPFFRGRYTGFDRRRNVFLMTDSLSCNKAMFVE